MKTLYFLTFLSVIITSCSSVSFLEPQPIGGTLLNEIPKELHGNWSVERDSIAINKNGFDINGQSIGPAHIILIDTFRLYKANNYYVFNFSKKDKEKWEIILLKKLKNGDINIYETRDYRLFANDKNLKIESINYSTFGNENNLDTTVNQINQDLHKKSDYQTAIFSGRMNIKTLDKITKNNKNIIFTLKKNGTIIPMEDGKIYKPKND
jgi:hypothetical protein